VNHHHHYKSQATSSFTSNLFTFLFLSLLIFSFRTVVENGTSCFISFVDGDPAVKSLLSRLDPAGNAVNAANYQHRRRSFQFHHLPQFSAIAAATTSSTVAPPVESLKRFDITDDLRSFVQGLTSTTFKHCPVNSDESESEGSDAATPNVGKDLNEFQEKHVTLVLTTVKEILRLR
jgi:hypothetical protein